MPVIISNNNISKALEKASKKAQDRLAKDKATNTKVEAICSKCNIELHIADDIYAWGNRYYCSKCKTPKATKIYVGYAFNLGEALRDI
jgi:Zn finger protein HypA/HybF involved in hydrogenase expression